MACFGHWTPALRARFLGHLAASGNVRAAARACGLSRQSVYKLRWRDSQFAHDWESALARRRRHIEREGAELLSAWCRRRLAQGLTGEAAAHFAALLERLAEIGGDPAATRREKPLLDTVNA